MCLCTECDAKLESEKIQGKFLNELCDCDIYTRWICHKCVLEERQFTRDHYSNHTAHEWDDRYWDGKGITKVMGDHQTDITVCIALVDQRSAGLSKSLRIDV